MLCSITLLWVEFTHVKAYECTLVFVFHVNVISITIFGYYIVLLEIVITIPDETLQINISLVFFLFIEL